MKTSTNFIGADAERLADCIKYAAKHGLAITEDTQSGINDNSGNVWLWDEDWSGCIYTSIGFDTGMMWSCSNCGEEKDCEIPAECYELNEFSNNNDGKCEACK